MHRRAGDGEDARRTNGHVDGVEKRADVELKLVVVDRKVQLRIGMEWIGLCKYAK